MNPKVSGNRKSNTYEVFRNPHNLLLSELSSGIMSKSWFFLLRLKNVDVCYCLWRRRKIHRSYGSTILKDQNSSIVVAVRSLGCNWDSCKSCWLCFCPVTDKLPYIELNKKSSIFLTHIAIRINNILTPFLIYVKIKKIWQS